MILYQSKANDFTIRTTERSDSALIHAFIKKLSIYEKLENQMVATIKDIETTIFDKKQAHVILAEVNQIPIGFALYFFNYSTFLGKANLFLEDIFIDEAYRHQGYGKKLFYVLAEIAVKNNCSRFDWMCLSWNQPSIFFYESLGAKPLSDWITFRLSHDDLKKVADLLHKDIN